MTRLAPRLLAALSLLAGGASAMAQQPPAKPAAERSAIVVPFTAGGPSDVVGRLLAEKLGAAMGETFRIQNTAGEGGVTGTLAVARAVPDGRTLLLHHFSLAAAKAFNPALTLDALRDLEPLGLVSQGPYILTVRTSLPVRTFAELTRHLKATPQTVIGHAGIASGSHLCNVLLRATLGVAFEERAYRGTGPAMTDLAAGQIDVLFDQAVSALPNVKEGTIRPIAVTGSRRLDALPNVPTLIELGLAEFEVTQWFALYAPAATPSPRVEALARALDQVLDRNDVAEGLRELGSEPFAKGERDRTRARAKLAAEIERWTLVAAATKPAARPAAPATKPK